MRVVAIPCRYGDDGTVFAYWLDAPEPALVDSGVVSSAPMIAAAVREAGRDLADLRWILLTHGHWDHTGGARALKAASSYGRIGVHEDDADLLRSRRTPALHGDRAALRG